MQIRTHFLTLTAGTLAVFSFGAALSAQASPPKTIIAVFSEEDAQFAETITLYSDGKYQQAETEKKATLYRPYSVLGPLSARLVLLPVTPDLLKRQRDPKKPALGAF